MGEYLTDCVRAISRENPKLQGVIDIVDFNATAAGQGIISDDRLRLLIDVLGRHRLGLQDVEPDILGRAYEYLLRKFDIVTANPMWNQDFPQETYENDPYNRFASGYPPSSSADWGWIQHMYTSLRNKGRMAVVLDTGTASRGSGNVGRNRERDIRKEFVDRDLVEAVILMPENMFYNTPSPGIILVINKAKRNPGEILLINASKLFEKGRPKNFLPESSIEQVADLYLNWKEEGISKIIIKEEAVKSDYDLSPARYVAQNGIDDTLPLDDAVVQLKEAEEEREEADKELREVLSQLGITL